MSDPPQKRQRIRAACLPCKQRKRKCNGKLPCDLCTRFEYSCAYPPGHQPPTTIASTQVQRRGENGRETYNNALASNANQSDVSPAQPQALDSPARQGQSVIDYAKERFVRASSALAFPRIIGIELDCRPAPRLHSFAWNLGIRDEPSLKTIDVTSVIPWVTLQSLLDIYLDNVHPVFTILHWPSFTAICASRYKGEASSSNIDAVIFGVAALGSFFSGARERTAESELVNYAKTYLQSGCSLISPLSNLVAAWILRTLYLRLTTRPQASWEASATTMHIVEAAGLHKELSSTSSAKSSSVGDADVMLETRRRLFWAARALNTFLSYEYGRSRIQLDAITIKRPITGSHEQTCQFVDIVELLPSVCIESNPEPGHPVLLRTACMSISQIQTKSHVITLFKADAVFLCYRRLYLTSLTDAREAQDQILKLGQAALAAATALLDSNSPWWQVVATPFQFLCILLAIDTSNSIAMLAPVLATLTRIAQSYDTHMVREALAQGKELVWLYQARKARDAASLGAILEMEGFPGPQEPATALELDDASFRGNLEWPGDIPFEWDMFLNPNLVV